MNQTFITLNKIYPENRPQQLDPEEQKLLQGISVQDLGGLGESLPLLGDTVALPPYV